MGVYTEQIVPRLIHLAMQRKDVRAIRREVLAGTEGVVLEVGFGSGLNLPFYSPKVTRVLALEPSTVARRLAAPSIRQARVPVQFIGLEGEHIPLPSASVDHVVTTWTLCTIPDPSRALAEIRRVLKPGGHYGFAEHGSSPSPRVARWQRRLNPLQTRLCGGCHLDRRIEELVSGAGFRILELSHPSMKGPKFATYLYLGDAINA